MRLLKTAMALLLWCPLAIGCSGEETDELLVQPDIGRDGGAVVPDLEDAQRDASDLGSRDVDQVEKDASEGSDQGQWDVIPAYSANLWTTPTCAGTVPNEPLSEGPFVMPEREEAADPILSAAEQRALFPGPNADRLLADPALHPGSGWVYDLFSPGPQNVHLYFYAQTSRDEQTRADQQMMFTLLVDYEPVISNWTRWNDQRTEPLLEKQGTSLAFDAPRALEIIDITIPAAVFSEPRAYEISFAQMEAPYANSSRSARRLVLYNGGYAIPSRPCALPALGDEITEFEKVLFPARVAATIFGDVTVHEGHLRGEPMIAEPGSKLTLHSTFWRTALSPKVTAVQPVVNGEPAGDPLWITQGGDNPYRYKFVDARFTFEVTLPEEPGVHAVSLATWEDAYRPCRDLEGNEDRDCSKSGSASRHSNVLRFDTTQR